MSASSHHYRSLLRKANQVFEEANGLLYDGELVKPIYYLDDIEDFKIYYGVCREYIGRIKFAIECLKTDSPRKQLYHDILQNLENIAQELGNLL